MWGYSMIHFAVKPRLFPVLRIHFVFAILSYLPLWRKLFFHIKFEKFQTYRNSRGMPIPYFQHKMKAKLYDNYVTGVTWIRNLKSGLWILLIQNFTLSMPCIVDTNELIAELSSSPNQSCSAVLILYLSFWIAMK